MFQEHSRFGIWSSLQHPYKHTLSDFGFINDALPGVSNVESALNFMLAVLYPNTKAAVANQAALPLVGNTINDYRVVTDDGDGKAASYRWEQREGEMSPSWHKIYDMDWGQDSVLAAFQDQTQDLYVWKYGRTDLDGSGAPITGLYAGQTIVGGTLTGQNLTLDANGVDSTGYVQTKNIFRPVANNTLDLGTSSEKWQTGYFGTSVIIGNLTLSTGSIVDSSGSVSFSNNNLNTTGNVTATSFIAGTLTIADGSIQDTDGTISFGATNITTTGTVTGAISSKLADITFANGSITSTSAAISFGSNNLTTTGTLQAGNATVTRLDSDNVRVDGNTISVLNTDGNLIVQANGAGIIDLQSAVTSLGITATGVVTVTGQVNADNLRLDGNVISSTDLNGNIILTPNGIGIIEVSSEVSPSADATVNLGANPKRFKDIHFSGSLTDGSTSIAVGTLLTLKDINVGVSTGMSLFWDGSKWAASVPDTEIAHGAISGLTTGDAGHSQFVMLAGRTGGQTVQGGIATGEHLVLESTSHATKGLIKAKDSLVPFATASYSGSWSGTDLGSASLAFNDLYTKGELKGARLENYLSGSMPSASAQNVGRAIWTTDNKKIMVDIGGSWQVAGSAKYVNDESFDGSQTSKTVTVSSAIQDARNALWQLLDNANDFERIYTTIKAISASQVQIITNAALPAGSYRLVGIE